MTSSMAFGQCPAASHRISSFRSARIHQGVGPQEGFGMDPVPSKTSPVGEGSETFKELVKEELVGHFPVAAGVEASDGAVVFGAGCPYAAP